MAINKKLKHFVKIFENEPFLAGYFLLIESIEKTTFKSIQLLGINVFHEIENSKSVKNGKILKLKRASQVAAIYINRSFAIKDNPDVNIFKERAGKLISALDFLFLLEDISTTLVNEYAAISKMFSDYNQPADASGTVTTDNSQQSDSQETQTGEEKSEDPTLEVLMGSNESKNMILRLMKVFNRQVQITKDVQSVKFFNAVKDLRNNSYVVMPPADHRPTAVDVTKLTFSQFQDLIRVLQKLSGQISRVRIAIGSSTPVEIRKTLLGER